MISTRCREADTTYSLGEVAAAMLQKQQLSIAVPNPPSYMSPHFGQPGSSYCSYQKHLYPSTSFQPSVLPSHGREGLGVGLVGVFDCDGKDVGSEVEGEFETVGA